MFLLSVCRNLLFLKTYEGDVSDLGLDFTVTTDVLGKVQVGTAKGVISAGTIAVTGAGERTSAVTGARERASAVTGAVVP